MQHADSQHTLAERVYYILSLTPTNIQNFVLNIGRRMRRLLIWRYAFCSISEELNLDDEVSIDEILKSLNMDTYEESRQAIKRFKTHYKPINTTTH